MLESLGVAEAGGPAILTCPVGLDATQAVADGLATLVLAQESEIRATAGLTLAGLLPEALNLATPYAAAIAARSTNRAGAQALLALMTGAEGEARLREAGLRRTGSG
jgi:ABC-type molybdate transport system substrate-binding protein